MKVKNLTVYIRSMGKALRVVAWFPSGELGEEQANAYMEKNPDAAVVAEADGMIILANRYDNGVAIPADQR